MGIARTFLAFVLLTALPMTVFAAPSASLPMVSPVAPASGLIQPPARDDSDQDSAYYEYGFEEGWNGWTTVDLTNMELYWHSSEERALDGRSFWCADEDIGGYADHWLQYLITPPLNLAGRQDLRLRFDINWAVENPVFGPVDTVAFPGYDGWDGCNVWTSINGGDSWQVLQPTRPRYNYRSLFSFGYEWGMGPGIPGWCESSDGWQEAEFSLANFARDNVLIRWAFCSDPALATPDSAHLYGMLVDNLQVLAGEEVVWSNNGDELGDMTRGQGPISGDHWEITDAAAHDGANSAHCPVGASYFNALVSPPIDVPAGGWYTYFDFWVRADFRRPDSDGDGYLDDYYDIQYSTDNQIWTRMLYDWGRDDPAWMDRFHYFGPDSFFASPYNSGQPEWMRKLNLTQFAGQRVWLRWRVQTDAVVDGDQGPGFYIDDFRVMITQRRENDVGVEWAWIKYPTAMGFTTPCRARVRNYGLADQAQVTKYYRVEDGADVPIPPFGAIPADTSRDYGFSLDSRRFLYADSLTIRVHAHSRDDSTHDNDTAFVNGVVVYPQNIWRLGYDNRSYRRFFDFDRGQGPAIRFTPTDDNIRVNFALKALRVRWNGAQGDQEVQTRLHIYRDNRGAVGQEIHSADVTVARPNLYPNVHVIDLSQVQALANVNAAFWVWFEILGDDFYPQIIGDEQKFGAGHYFDYDGRNLVEMEADWQCHAMLMPTGAAPVDQLLAGRSVLNFGNVAAGETKRMRLALFDGGVNEVTINSVTSPHAAFQVEFAGPVTLRIGDMAHVYVTFAPESGDPASSELAIECSDPRPPRVTAVGNGGNAAHADAPQPRSFSLGAAYPNPFNSRTVIPFSLGAAVTVKLAVYDLSGRQVALLVNGRREAGAHSVAFDASRLTTGIYLYRLDAGSFSSIRKVIVVK